MIPLRDNQPTSSFPLVTVILIALNVVVFLAQIASGGAMDASLAMVPREVTHNIDLVGTLRDTATGRPLANYGPSPHPLWLTVFTSMFMHGGWGHLGGNMLFLWIFGNNIEDALGKVKYLLFYLACGVAAAALQIATAPDSPIPNLGASGAIAGVLGAYLLLYPNARVLTIVPLFFAFFVQLPAYVVLLAWIGLQLFLGAQGWGMQQGGGIAYFAHIGGFAAGMILITLLGGKRLVARQTRLSSYTPRY